MDDARGAVEKTSAAMSTEVGKGLAVAIVDVEPPPTYTFPIDHGALTDVPVWQTHRRGTNWASTITGVNPTQPGGFDRVFWDKARGNEHYYVVPQWLLVGSAVEFAADYTTTGNRKDMHRWCGVVLAVSSTEVVLAKYDSPRAAYDAGQAMLAEQVTRFSDAREATYAQILTMLNEIVLEPGQRWYGQHRAMGPAARRSGKLATMQFTLYTDAAAREHGLLAEE
jgi:hypothetical protein